MTPQEEIAALTEERQRQEDDLAVLRGCLRAFLDLPWRHTLTGMARATTPDWGVITNARLALDPEHYEHFTSKNQVNR